MRAKNAHTERNHNPTHAAGIRVVHLPCYDVNPYQEILMGALRDAGCHVINGGAGGNFLRTALRKWKPDVMHFHWLHPYLLQSSRWRTLVRANRFLAEVRLIRSSGTKIAWTVHNLSNHARQEVDAELAYTRKFASLCDAIFTHGAEATRLAKQRFAIPESVPIVEAPLPNYTTYYRNEIEKPTARQLLSLPADARVVTFLGRIEPYKQVTELIQAFRHITGDRFRLLVVGSCTNDDYRGRVETAATADSRVRLLMDHAPDNDVQKFVNAADLIACTSEGILTSSSVSLAMSFGRPPLAPSDGCIPENVDGAGFHYDNSDPSALRSVLHRALNSEQEILDRMGVEARSKIEAASPSRVAQHLVHAYSSALERSFAASGI